MSFCLQLVVPRARRGVLLPSLRRWCPALKAGELGAKQRTLLASPGSLAVEAPAGSTRAAVGTAVGGPSAGPPQHGRCSGPRRTPAGPPPRGPHPLNTPGYFLEASAPTGSLPGPTVSLPGPWGPSFPEGVYGELEGVYGELDRPGAWLCPTEGMTSCRPPSTLLRRLCIGFKGTVGAGASSALACCLTSQYHRGSDTGADPPLSGPRTPSCPALPQDTPAH